jgi:hypothetical protein
MKIDYKYKEIKGFECEPSGYAPIKVQIQNKDIAIMCFEKGVERRFYKNELKDFIEALHKIENQMEETQCKD